MSYEKNDLRYHAWINSIKNGDKIQILDNESYDSLGLYNIKKNTKDNTVNFTRTIPQYKNWGFDYDEENNITIDSSKIKNYTYSDPNEYNILNEKQTFDKWYDSIDEKKMYALKENNFWGKPLKGNYNARKYTDTRGEKNVVFKRETSIMSNFWESDPYNDIIVSQDGINYFDNNCKCDSYTRYTYYSKSKDLALAEEDAKYSCPTRGWF